MPYLPTSQAYLEQSAQLLQAYPDTVSTITPHPTPPSYYPPHLVLPPQRATMNTDLPTTNSNLNSPTNNPPTRIVTKYSFPTNRRGNLRRSHKSQIRKEAKAKATDGPSTTPAHPSAATATLTLKTFNPTTGICLHYRTNKLQEVGRLMTSLGKLAAGADVAALGLSAAVPAAGADVEMVDAPAEEVATPAATKAQGQGQNAKGKKKGGKGKR
ncbi:uncharacterized protein N7479_010550 [Penicillium vulpinum]|uniref:uncharacterized protein n=1 Tax=Penicillium vulpinum TaxID=29845 RepID=UPI0025496FDA|nr:uncharacterized protein N7479_010550 [Penicillium vulpinum]KAJ5952137.1 hypothetical protein N7479_010550 [Penicillium vulpinum]